MPPEREAMLEMEEIEEMLLTLRRELLLDFLRSGRLKGGGR